MMVDLFLLLFSLLIAKNIFIIIFVIDGRLEIFYRFSWDCFRF